MRKSVFRKIFGGYFILAVVLAALIFFSIIRTFRSYHIEHLTKSLENTAIALHPSCVSYMTTEPPEKLDRFIKELGEKFEIRITVVDTNGVVLADSDNNISLMENHKNRPEIKESLEFGRVGISSRFSTTMDKNLLYVAMPLKEDNRPLGVLRLSVSYRKIDSVLVALEWKIVRFTLFSIFISLILAFLLARGLASPIKKITRAYKNVAHGDLDTRVFLSGSDELKELADGFNNMIAELKGLITEISNQKAALDTIFSSIKDALCLMDEEGRVIIGNDSFKELIKTTHINGKYYWEVIRYPNLLEVLRKETEIKEEYIEEIAINENMYIANLYYLENTKETLLSLHDVTERRRLERIKKDFVVNVSHELRTPLTAIKGFVETLEDSVVDDENLHYLEIVRRHTDRLINIVKDLLLLSKLEEDALGLELKQISLEGFIRNNVKIFSEKLAKKDLDLELNIQEDLPEIFVDPFKLEQVFINLIYNAIKYTDEGKITVSAEKVDETEEIKIVIEDTGIGISNKMLPRIFERFFVVDSSRSKKFGGTGLGLSIVKHIILLHNGRIDVESTEGVGTTFIIFLPVIPKAE